MKTSPKKIPFKEFKYIYSKIPRLCVDLVIKNNNGIILSKRDIDPYKGMWHIPGGTVLMGEKLHKAVKRVAQEETNLKVKIINLIAPIEYLENAPRSHTVTLAFLVKPISGVLKGSNQGKDIRFFKKIPANTIKEQKNLLIKKKLL